MSLTAQGQAGAAPRPVLVLGLGNPIVTDDAVGLLVAREVQARLAPGEETRIEVAEAEIAGFALMDLLEGRPGAVIIDALEMEGHEPGTILEWPMAAFQPTSRLMAAHQIDLPTALALGRELGREMPEAVTVLAVVVADARTFGEVPTLAVAAAVGPAAARALVLARELAAGAAPGDAR